MKKATKFEWIVTFIAFVTSVTILITSGYDDRTVISSVSFLVAVASYVLAVRYEKKK